MLRVGQMTVMVRRLKDISDADLSNSWHLGKKAVTTAGGTPAPPVFELLQAGNAWFEGLGCPSASSLGFATYPAINRLGYYQHASGAGCALSAAPRGNGDNV